MRQMGTLWLEDETAEAVQRDREARLQKLFSTGGLRALLSGAIPGRWASDHHTELTKFTGWNYVAIRAIALQACQAIVEAHRPPTMRAADDFKKRLARREWRYTGGHWSYVAPKSVNPDDDEGEPLAQNDPLVKLLERPNPRESGGMFRYQQIVQLQLTGSCYVWNRPNGFGLTVERYVIPRSWLTPRQPTYDMPLGGYYVAHRQPWAASDNFSPGIAHAALNQTIPAEQMQIIRWPHPFFPEDGYGPIAAGAQWIDAADMIDQRRHSQLVNGVDPTIAVMLAKELNYGPDKLAEFSRYFNSLYAGPDNAGKAIVMNQGEVIPVSTSPKDMMYSEGFEDYKIAGLALHGVTPIAAGMVDGGGYAELFAALLQFTMLTVQPSLDMLSAEDNYVIAKQYSSAETIISYTAQSIQDPAMEETKLQNDIAAGTVTKNEVRIARGREPWPMPECDQPIKSSGELAADQMKAEAEAAKLAASQGGGQSNGASFDGGGSSPTRSGVHLPKMLANGNGHANGHHASRFGAIVAATELALRDARTTPEARAAIADAIGLVDRP